MRQKMSFGIVTLIAADEVILLVGLGGTLDGNETFSKALQA